MNAIELQMRKIPWRALEKSFLLVLLFVQQQTSFSSIDDVSFVLVSSKIKNDAREKIKLKNDVCWHHATGNSLARS